MRNIVGIIGMLATIYIGAPKAADWIYASMRNIAIKQSSAKMTSFTEISEKLTK